MRANSQISFIVKSDSSPVALAAGFMFNILETKDASLSRIYMSSNILYMIQNIIKTMKIENNQEADNLLLIA